jgi:hypothetical protein
LAVPKLESYRSFRSFLPIKHLAAENSQQKVLSAASGISAHPSFLLSADLGDLLQGAIERVARIKAIRLACGIRPAPQRLADHRVIRVLLVFVAAESLLRAVIKAGNSLQREEAAEPQRDLIDKLRVAGEAETLALIVIVQKGTSTAPALRCRCRPGTC